MIKPNFRCGAALLLCAVVILTSACNTTPERPPPPPKPVDVLELEPPPPPLVEKRQDQQKDPQPASDSAREQNAAMREYAQPSENAAEVEVEEFAVEASDPGPEMTEHGAQAGSSPGARGGQAGAGGSSRPASAASNPATDADADSGVIVLNPAGGESDPDLVGPNIQIGAKTSAEHVAALDAELERSLSSFDERMRRARAAANAERTELARASDGAPLGAPGGRGSRHEAPRDPGAGGAAARSSGLGNTPDASGESGGAGQVAVYAPPAGIPDGGDDDIVARQLREAASKESDPLLREKLWQEYRKYKAGL